MSWECPSCGLENTDETSLKCYCGYELEYEQSKDVNTKTKRSPRFDFFIIILMWTFVFILLKSTPANAFREHWEISLVVFGIGLLVLTPATIIFTINYVKNRKNNIPNI